MFFQIVKNSQLTNGYLEYALKTLLRRESTRPRKSIELKVVEGITPYPEIKLVDDKNISQEELYKIEEESGGFWSQHITSFNLKGETLPISEQVIKHNKRDLVISYTLQNFENECNIKFSEIDSDNYFGTIFHVIPKDFNALRQKAKALGVNIISRKELVEKLNNSPAEFIYNPPHIRWADFIIEIPANSKEFDLCKVAFLKEPKMELSWDEVAEEIDRELINNLKKGRQIIYDIIRRINDRVRAQTKKDLFKWTELGFYRKY